MRSDLPMSSLRVRIELENRLFHGYLNSCAVLGFTGHVAARTETLQTAGAVQAVALSGGYGLTFAVGALFALAAAGLGAWLMRPHMKATVAA